MYNKLYMLVKPKGKEGTGYNRLTIVHCSWINKSNHNRPGTSDRKYGLIFVHVILCHPIVFGERR